MEDLHRWWKKSRRTRANSFRNQKPLSLKASRIGDPRLMLPPSVTLSQEEVKPANLTSKDDLNADNNSDTSSVSNGYVYI